MQVDFLIIGQGISGTWLSYYLEQEKKSFLVIDNDLAASPSRMAAGIINPVTGRRHVEVWMADTILPFARDAYKKIGAALGINAFSHSSIIDFFPTPQMRVSFMHRVEEKNKYLHPCLDQSQYGNQFNYDFGCGEINNVSIAHLETLLPAWRNHLKETQSLLEESFDIQEIRIGKNGITYKDITAGKIIFCDGNASANSPYFNKLPFAPNKGEVLLLEINDLKPDRIYKKGMMLVPLSTAGQWWIGSSYAWQFDDADPTPAFREKTELLLKSWLKVPFRITDHLAGIRPATLERRPFVGVHPKHPGIAILNGMGTKGCSLAPYFARQLVRNICRNEPLQPDADINRFKKILLAN